MLTPKKLDLKEDKAAQFFAERFAFHFTEEVMNMPKPEKPVKEEKAS